MLDISAIHQKAKYPIPEKTLREWSEGIGFGRKVAYNTDEMRRLELDMAAIRDEFLYQYSNPYYTRTIGEYIPPNIKTYLAPTVSYVANLVSNFLKTNGFFKECEKWAILTAGAPGAGKTVLFESLMPINNIRAPYLDPDAVFLKKMMKHTYQADLEQALKAGGDEKTIRQEMYDKWRPASNFLTHIWMAYFIGEGSSFYFGTTASSPQMADTFQYYRDSGRKIKLIHVSAPDDVRWESIKLRDKEFVQTTEQDIREKGDMVPKNIERVYLKANEIDFYWRAKADGNAIHAATWIQNGNLTVHDETDYQAIIDLNTSKAPDTAWPDALKK